MIKDVKLPGKPRRDSLQIEDYVCVSLPVVSWLPGFFPLLRRFSPMANLQVSACQPALRRDYVQTGRVVDAVPVG
jgi:hypothetical protein